MCGIAGIVSKKNSEDNIKINNALRCITHRGPDAFDVKHFQVKNNSATLGHVRLSIIDLSESGKQPMTSSDGCWTIIFNGEIYNYKEIRKELEQLSYIFKTNTDTEVLLNAWAEWGEDCLKHLIGMFAFAILDKNKGIINCVRDAFGIKPLFYYMDEESISFASEIDSLKELLPNKPKLNIQRAYDYLVHGDYENGVSTFYEGIKYLPPGSILRIDISDCRIKQIKKWWIPSTEERGWNFDNAVEHVRDQFLENIKYHLRSDVPIGVALSGGIDSSAIACSIRYIERDMPIKTFSYIANDSSLNEEYWINKVNKYINAESIKVKLDVKDLMADIDNMISIQGEPFGGTSIYASYKIFQAARKSGTKVMLEGQGADEMLAGYDGYPGHRMISLLETGNIIDAIKFFNKTARWPNRSSSMVIKYMISELTKGSLYEQLRKIDGKGSTPNWINKKYLLENGVHCIKPRWRFYESLKGRKVISELALSLSERGIASLLRHGDRNAMCFSIENRVPFLTLELTEALLSMPEEYLISKDGQTKNVFREAMRGIVPSDVLYRKDKIGFETPEKDWIIKEASSFRKWIEVDLELPFINKNQLLNNFDDVISGRKGYNKSVWRWINFHRWYVIKFN